MKRLFGLLVCLAALLCTGATYYVRTDGHNTADGTQDSADTTHGAWLTVQKAVDTITGGDTVLIADGTYAEGTLLTVRTALTDYPSMVYICSQSADPTKVTIKSSGGGSSENTRIGSANVTWSNVTFSTAAASDTSVIRLRNSTNGWWYGCNFVLASPNAGVKGIYVLVNTALTNQHFINCNITQTGNTNSCDGIYLTACNGFELTGSTITIPGGYGIEAVNALSNMKFLNNSVFSTNNHAFYGNAPLTNLFFTNDTFATFSVPFKMGFYMGTAFVMSNLVFSSCTFTSGLAEALVIDNCQKFLMENSTLGSGSGTHALEIGRDQAFSNTYQNTGTVQNCSFKCYGLGDGSIGAGHGALIGDHCGNITFINNDVVGMYHGLVIKSAANVDAEYNTIRSLTNNNATASGLYFKESQAGCKASHNIIYGPTGGIAVQAGGGDGNNFTNAVCTYNWIICPTNTVGINWGASASDLGGCTVDYNTYFFSGPVKIGQVNGGAVATNFRMWATNWTGYSIAGNETHSYYGPTFNPGFAQ